MLASSSGEVCSIYGAAGGLRASLSAHCSLFCAASCRACTAASPPGPQPPPSSQPANLPSRHRNRPRAGAAGLRCAFALAGCGGCGGGSSRWRAAAAVAFASAGCCANTSGGGSPNFPEDSSAYVEVNLLSVWSASILVSKHFPILHTPSTVSIRTPPAAASSILIDGCIKYFDCP